jgi:tetratricopeptide (TPR) repeat protein
MARIIKSDTEYRDRSQDVLIFEPKIMPKLSKVAAKQSCRRTLLLILGPIVGAIIGAVSNVLTNHWNWWLFSILAVIVALAAVVAVALDEGAEAKRNARAAARVAQRRRKVPRVNTLPRDVDDFTGRRSEVSLLLAMIGRAAQGGGRIAVYSVEGIGGVGKTSLAVHVAHRIAKNYPDAALFIDLRAHVEGQTPVPASEALAILLSDLGVPGESIPDSLEGRASLWRGELSDARALVILDNAAGPDQIRDLLAVGNRCLIIITSRQRMIEVPGISSVPVESLPPADAAALFARVLDVDPTGPQDADIADMARRLGGLPLAITLAAARLRAHPTWTVHDLLEQDIGQHTSLERVYALSYQDLDPGLRSFFRLLSVHPGAEITAEAAAVLTGTSLSATSASIEELYNRYLLTEPVRYRFRFHDLIKDFANREGSGMNDAAARREALLRLLGYYAFMAESASRKIGMSDLFSVPPPTMSCGTGPPSDDASALTWFDTELGNLLSCARYASGHGLLPFGWQLPASMTYYLRLRGFLGQVVALLDGALQMLDRQADLLGEATIRRRRGQLARLQGDFALSRNHLDRSMRLTEELGDRQGMAWCHHELGHLARVEGDLPAARRHFAEAVAIHRELGNLAGLSDSENYLGVVLQSEGDIDRARECMLDALRVSADSQNWRMKPAALYRLGALERDSGNYPAAREMITEALEIYDRFRNRHGQAECHLNLAIIDRLTGGYEQARRHLNEALGIYVELGYQQGEADTYAELATIAETAGDPAMALVLRQQADAIYANLRQDVR